MPRGGEYTADEIAVLRSIGRLAATWDEKTTLFNSRSLSGRPFRSAAALRRKWNRLKKAAKKHRRTCDEKKPLSEDHEPDDEKPHGQTKADATDPIAWQNFPSWQAQEPYHGTDIPSYLNTWNAGLGITGVPALDTGYEGVNLSGNADSAQYFQGGWLQEYEWNGLGGIDASLLMAATSILA